MSQSVNLRPFLQNLRLQRVNSYMSAIHELTVVMSLDFKKIIANINPSLANHLSVQSKSISNETLASLTSEVNSLKQLKQQRLERVGESSTSVSIICILHLVE